jgi:hypothetical protein
MAMRVLEERLDSRVKASRICFNWSMELVQVKMKVWVGL